MKNRKAKHKGKKKFYSNNFILLPIVFIIIFYLTFQVTLYLGREKSKQLVEENTSLPYIPQFVLISFDGSKSIDMWRKIHTLEEELKGEGKSLNVTNFINAAYFLDDETKDQYKGPGKEKGKTNIGFSDDFPSIKERINEINIAVAGGDEIADHTVGHFSGTYWTKEDWNEELTSFDKIIFRLQELYPDKDLPKLNLHRRDMVGFRAPFLDKSPGLYEALHERHFLYDTSEIGKSNLDWPTKDSEGLWHIPMGTIWIDNLPILAMDFNIMVHDSNGNIDLIKKGTPEWDTVFDNTLNAFLNYFDKNYTTTRAPVLVGYHFEEWNHGVYWEALKEFSRQVCGKPEVRCGTFKELVEYMEKYGVPNNQ